MGLTVLLGWDFVPRGTKYAATQFTGETGQSKSNPLNKKEMNARSIDALFCRIFCAGVEKSKENLSSDLWSSGLFFFELAQRDGRRSSCVMISYCFFIYQHFLHASPKKALNSLPEESVMQGATPHEGVSASLLLSLSWMDEFWCNPISVSGLASAQGAQRGRWSTETLWTSKSSWLSAQRIACHNLATSVPSTADCF